MTGAHRCVTMTPMSPRWLPFALAPFALAPLALVHACSTDPTGSGPGAGGVDDDGGNAASPDGGSTTDASAASDAAPDAPDANANADAAALGQLFAFVGSADGKIRVYAVDANSGGWTLAKESPAGTNPSFLAFDPPRRRVVAIDEGDPGMVRSFAFDSSSGTLTERNAQPSGGAGPAHLSLDPTGAHVLVANYTGGTASVLPLDASGMLGAASDTKSPGAMCHWAGTDPGGTHAFVSVLGADLIGQYSLDAMSGKLADNGVAALAAGVGPRHLAFHPSAKWAYVVNETAISVTTLDYAATTGQLAAKQTLSALPPAQSTAGVSGAEIFVHPSGAHVYASTRVYDSIAHFTVSPTDGTLTYVASTGTGADRPRSFGLAPEGTLLFAANQDANQVVGFRIDAATGALTSLGKTVDVPSPAFVGLTRMPP
jgi:6-phosphogluconolactonase